MSCLGPIGAACCALALGNLALTQDPRPEGTPEAPPPAADAAQQAPDAQRKLGNMWAVQATARVLFEGNAEPYTLDMTYAFPARARWTMRPAAGVDHRRIQLYRFGATLHGWDSGVTASRVLAEPERVQTLRQFELMRATLLWPDSHAWQETEGGHVADLGAAGKLFAPRSGGERPEAFYMLGPDGAVGDSAHVESWSQQSGRWWPARWHMESGGRVTSRQEMERAGSALKLDTALRVHDSFFTPPDRRTVWQATPVKSLEQIDLDARPVRRIALESGGDWDAAVAEAEEVRARYEELGGLTRWNTLEIDARAVPRALWLELEPGRTPPEGWTVRRETPALRVALESRAGVTGSLLRKMRESAGEGVRTGPALIRLRGALKPVQVIVPLLDGE